MSTQNAPKPNATDRDLDEDYKLTPEQIAYYRENGYIKLKHVLKPETIAQYKQAINDDVYRRNNNTKPMAERTTYDKAFIQVGNLWRENPVMKRFCFSRKLARIATELMGTTGVRMWHDQALHKEAGGGHTPWHCDQYYWPMHNANSTTVWIPLQPVPLEMGPLAFAKGSHRVELGRELEISDESEERIAKTMAGMPLDEGPFDLGEVSYHAGWTFHRARGNSTKQPREVMTIIYMDEQMRLKKPSTKGQENDRSVFCKGLEVGDLMTTEMTPVIYQMK